MSDVLPAAVSGQPQAQRFNQPISFVSSGTVGTDPMEIRPALLPASPTPALTTVDAMGSDPSIAATAGAPADDNAVRWASSGAQLQHVLQAAEPPLASISTQAQTPGEPRHSCPASSAMCLCCGLLPAWHCHAAVLGPQGLKWFASFISSFLSEADYVQFVTGAAEAQQESDLSASEAPWNALEPASSGAQASLHPGLGCAALPDFDYPEDSHAGLGSQDAARPLYDR